MNKENLLKAADYVEKIEPKWFNMAHYRLGLSDKGSKFCGTTGCIIGHCTALDTDENIDKYRHEATKFIEFDRWSRVFFDVNEMEWIYLFSSLWANHGDTPKNAAKRIRHFVENGLPIDMNLFLCELSRMDLTEMG